MREQLAIVVLGLSVICAGCGGGDALGDPDGAIASDGAGGTGDAAPPTADDAAAPADDAAPPGDASADADGAVNQTTPVDGGSAWPAACSLCHGSAVNPAPPRPFVGASATSNRRVGAHQSHLGASTWHHEIKCNECHIVPTSPDADPLVPTHMNMVSDLVWGPIAKSGSYNPATATCTGTYCHGATLKGDPAGLVSSRAPSWTTVNGTQAACGTSCHTLPPGGGHPASTACPTCHTMTIASFTPGSPPIVVWKNAALHIDGKVDLDGAALTCTTCHGTVATGNPAPPRGTSGELTTAQRAVGAHAQHLAASTWHRDGQCIDCHTLPVATNHSNGVTDFTWGAVSTAKASAPSYSPVSATCSDVYCHGGKLLGPAPGGVVSRSPVWNVVNGSYDACGTTCHTNPPGGKHPQQTACPVCHGDVIATYNPATTASTWKDRALHVNGKVEVAGCGGCHAVPPRTGAHVAHYGDAHDPPLATYGDLRSVTDYAPGGSPAYIFGCGNCHPIDPARHADGVVDVDLSPAGAAAGSLKAKNAALASYAGGACSGVYCHSSGQEAPAYVASPPWNGAFAGPRCAACHTNPPAYPSGGAGSATANTHLVLADDGFELGHFGGMPGAWHTSYHGAQGSAPITCQTCHYLTVDPANVGPGGFYYLDTDGQYNLGGGLNYSCAACHTGAVGAPAVKSGKVLTAKHVNGVRDVAFDPRAAIAAAVTGLPAGANRPTYPYWVKAAPFPLPPRSTQNGTSWSLELSGSTYDPATKTCGSVPCHLKQSFGAGAPGFVPLRWGLTPVGNATCNDCHVF